jgi:hypothetical protein
MFISRRSEKCLDAVSRRSISTPDLKKNFKTPAAKEKTLKH